MCANSVRDELGSRSNDPKNLAPLDILATIRCIKREDMSEVKS